MRTSNLLLVLAASLALAGVGACSGDSTDSDGTGGAGGKILDSGQTDAVTEVAEEAALPEATVDATPDVAADQSVQPDTAVPDVEVSDGSLFDLTMPDVVLDDSGATLQGCYDCAVDGCPSEMQACEDNDKCRTILLCLFEEQCFGGPNGIDYGCGMGCATKAGVTNLQDPAVGIAMSAGQCIAGACQEDCALPEDAGI
jgi:hypothetical protein